ncbi:MAG: hypothetical protein WBW70_06345 [Candidatus Sulfotelmatobacter sp.]
MNYLMPSYLIPYLLSGTLAITAMLLFGLDSALRLARWPARERKQAVWSIGVPMVAWLFAALLLSWFGFYRGVANRFPTIPYGVLIPIVTGVALFWRWGMLKRALEAVPLQWIVGVQVYRALGFIFLILYAGGHLPGEFAWPAGVGDVMVGLLAPMVGLAYARGSRRAAGYVRAWNLLGICDLVVALTMGVLTSPSPLQRLAFGAPNELVSAFPLALVPVFLVPLSVLLHFASLNKLQQTEPAQRVSRSPLAASGGN